MKAKKVTKAMVKKYMKKRGIVCPVCGSTKVLAGDREAQEEFIFQNVFCEDCGAAWVDHYKLVGFDELEVSEKRG